RHAVAAVLRSPELDRHHHAPEAVGTEEDGERIDDDGGLEARVMDERRRRQFAPADLLAQLAGRSLWAQCCARLELGIGADSDETRVPAARKAEETDTLTVD